MARRHNRYIDDHPAVGVAVFRLGGKDYQTVGDPQDPDARVFYAKDATYRTPGVVPLYGGKPNWEVWPSPNLRNPQSQEAANELLNAAKAAYQQKFPGGGFKGGQIEAQIKAAEDAKAAKAAKDAEAAQAAETKPEAEQARKRAAYKRQLAQVAPGLLARRQREAEAAQEDLVAAVADGSELAQYDAVQAAEAAIAANNALDEFADLIDGYVVANPEIMDPAVIAKLPPAFYGLFNLVFSNLAEVPEEGA